MKRTIASLLSAKAAAGHSFTLSVTFQGKQKAADVTVDEVLADGVRSGTTIYPFATMTQIDVVET